MNNNIDIKDLWNKQEFDVPDIHELFKKARELKKSNLIRLLITNVLLILTVAFVVFIWYYYQPEMLTTKLGIILVVLAMVLYLFAYNQMIPILVKVDFNMSNRQYLQQLLKLKEQQSFLQKTILNIYCILLLSGICMYLVEFALRMSFICAALTYGITILYIVVNWLYIIPGTMKKQQTKIAEFINTFEKINNQLIEE